MPDEMFPSLTIIIPTYNREVVLAKALEGYQNQSAPQLIRELLVMDDGSTDGTEAMVQEFTRRAAFPVRYFRQANKGPAAARNYGIREAQSSLLLFTDSDIIPARNLVEEHVLWHRRHPDNRTAVLGYVTWSPEVKPTPFMRWYGEEKLFAFRTLRNQKEASFRCFYTCNVSVKTAFLRTCGLFDEDFKTAAFEDTELGFRLSQQGLLLLYNASAVAYHYQFFSFAEACRKTRNNAAAARLFGQKEAGKQVMKEVAHKKRWWGYRIARVMAVAAAWTLWPVRTLLDSSAPLPGIIYHLFFWNDAVRASSIDE